jgi:D-lactate dehydrogenase
MKTIFYSTKDFEQPYLERANKISSEVSFITDTLSVQTAYKAKGYDIVCIFPGDNAGAEVLDLLFTYGIKYIAIRAAGYDNVDLKKATSLYITVANVPEYSPYAIAEHATTLLLALNRKIVTANKQVHDQNFTLSNLMGFDLNGKTVGIIGTGKTGSVFSKIMNGFGCKLLGYDIRQNKELEKYGIEYVTLPELCKASNIISIHTSLNPGTKYLIDKKTIALMQGVILINTSRGACVNTADIIEGLGNGHIRYYGADVYENEKGIFFYDHSGNDIKDEMLKKLLSLQNVLITPHQAFATKEALTNIAATTFYNISRWSNSNHSEYELNILKFNQESLRKSIMYESPFFS